MDELLAAGYTVGEAEDILDHDDGWHDGPDGQSQRLDTGPVLGCPRCPDPGRPWVPAGGTTHPLRDYWHAQHCPSCRQNDYWAGYEWKDES